MALPEIEIEPTPAAPAAGNERQWRGKDVVLMTATIIPAALIPLFIGVLAAFALNGAIQDPSILQDQAAITAMLTGPGFIALNLVINCIAIIGGVCLIAKIRKKLSLDTLWLRWPSWRWILYSALATVVLVPIAGQINYYVGTWIYGEFNNWQALVFTNNEFTWFGAISMTLLGGIVTPFAEELFFRGILFRWMADKWNLWVGIIVSSLVFGAVHLEPAVAISTSVIGAVMAWFTWKTKSLWPAVTIHVLNNTFAIVAMFASLYFGWDLV